MQCFYVRLFIDSITSPTSISIPISTPISTLNQAESSNVVSIAIGSTIGAIVLLIVIVVGVGVLLYYYKRRKSMYVIDLSSSCVLLV